MSQEYDYGYDYDDGSNTYDYGGGEEGFDHQVSHNFTATVAKPLYTSRSEHQTEQRVIEIARELGSQIGYENATAECVALLVASQFDVYRATQLIFDETSLVARNIANGDTNDANYLVAWDDKRKGQLIANTEDAECATCYADIKPGEGRAFCKHFMCDECWRAKLNVHRTDNWTANRIVLRCEEVKKPTCLGMTLVLNIEPDLTTFLGAHFASDYFPKHRYQWCKSLPEVSRYPGKTTFEATNVNGKTESKSFDHCRFVVCGTDDCGTLFEVERELYDAQTKETIVGKCGTCQKRTCFLCQMKEHSPATCAAMDMWRAKENDEGLNAQWVLVHTKQCPKCHTGIEKNEGCNHMTCKRCAHEFCWICMGLWSTHGSSYYKCNKPLDPEADKSKNNVEAARASLARYTHYYERYRNHINSVKLDEKTMAAVQQYISNNFGGENISYLEDVAKALFDCRYTLANTYIYAYFETSKLDIFEFNQGRLEHATEELSRIVEMCKRGATIGTTQQEIQNKASVAKHYLEVLRKGI